MSGVSDQGYLWTIEAGGSDDNFMITLRLFKDGRRVFGGGMAGAKLFLGTVIHSSHHRKDDLPWVIVARTAPEIDRVLATTNLDAEIDLPLSEVIDQFGLRFTACVLPEGHTPGSIRAESHGQVVQSTRQRTAPRRRPGFSGSLPADPD